MWEMFLDWIFSCIAWFQTFVCDWGMAIIIITVIFRLIILPITIKQNKSTYLMNKINPKIQEAQAKYADDKAKLAEETQRLYKEAKFNPLTGCLPVLLQMPIFLALFQTLQNIGNRVAEGTVVNFYGILPDLTMSPMDVFQQMGLVDSIPYFLFVALFGVSIIVPTLINKTNDKQQTLMMGLMSLMMLYIGCISPAGVLLYWDVSSLIGILQQLLSIKLYKKKDAEIEATEVKPVVVNVERKQAKPRPTKKKKKK